jgi:hypothetical protein
MLVAPLEARFSSFVFGVSAFFDDRRELAFAGFSFSLFFAADLRVAILLSS